MKPRTVYLLRRCYAVIHERLRTLTAAYGLAPAEYKMLSFIVELAPCSGADLARKSEVTPQAITQQVAQLELRGLIRRFPHEENRRIVLIAPTEAGSKALANCDRAAAALDEALFGALSARELAAFRAVLSGTTQAAAAPNAAAPAGGRRRNEDAIP